MPIEAVVFDLADSSIGIIECTEFALQRLGYPAARRSTAEITRSRRGPKRAR